MAFLNQELSFDMGHLLLLVGLVIIVFIILKKSSAGTENLNVPFYGPRKCRCEACLAEVQRRVENDEFPGCKKDGVYPYSPDECLYQMHQARLIGCSSV